MASSDWSVYESQNYDGVCVQGLKSKRERPGAPKAAWVKRWTNEGMRRTARAVFITHTDGIAHLVVFRQLTPSGEYQYLCGGKLAEGESEKDGLSRHLRSVIMKDKSSDSCEWKVGEMLAKFYRPEFDERIYPYIPPHVTRPKEEISLFQVVLPPRCVFALRAGESIAAIPMHEIFKSPDNFPSLIAAIPELMSRFTVYNYVPGRPGFAPL
jgi:cleavage and polyadenylation specificity factor subunit 5